MKDNVAIRVSGLSKKYEIGKQKDGSLRGTIASIFNSSSKAKEEFWALKDVSFEVKKGEVIGIIGKNGSGKSTLLKVLSQITKPSTGKIEINGRVASLLEVGTGFHPELTGRENVYLNGTILGMTRKEVAAKFDEIVAFSGVEKFIDTPVKHYSSGMYVRLAFAVAAHLEPEILIIDEVLAVGDAEFQKKCLGKMKDVAGEGRTVLFVSHNMVAVNSLCNECIFIHEGNVLYRGNTIEAIQRYNGLGFTSSHSWKGNKGDQSVRLLSTSLNTESGTYFTDESIEVCIKINVLEKTSNLVVGFHLISEFGDPLAYAIHGDYQLENRQDFEIGRHSCKFVIPANTLAKGKYYLKIDLGIHNVKFITQGVGDLKFNTMNRTQIGCRYPVIDTKGYASLIRANWEL